MSGLAKDDTNTSSPTDDTLPVTGEKDAGPADAATPTASAQPPAARDDAEPRSRRPAPHLRVVTGNEAELAAAAQPHQRIGDAIWMAADARCKGFLLGGTAGRTTLAGEGLQHQDGQSHIQALVVPNLMAYDPAYAYEIVTIITDGLRRMYHEMEDVFYYITLQNEPYAHPPMPEGVAEGILKGIYPLRAAPEEAGAASTHRLSASTCRIVY